MIEINNVFFSCKNTKIDEKIILNNINLSIQAGESVLLAGNNGSGKTSLLKILTSEITPLVGTTKIDNHNIVEFSREEIFKTITLISGKLSDFIIDNFTFIENIYLYTMHDNRISPFFGMNKTRKLEIIDTIKSLNLGINVDEIADRKISELPNFYKHILILMIGLIKQPKILLIDDVFSEIDGSDIEHVFPILTKICDSHKFTTLITTDNPYLINKICNKVIILSNGKIVLDEKSGNIDNSKIVALFKNHFQAALNKKKASDIQPKVEIEQKSHPSTSDDMGTNSQVIIKNKKLSSATEDDIK